MFLLLQMVKKTNFVLKDLTTDSTITVFLEFLNACLTYPGDVVKVTGPIINF
ncbi:MAG: hypothetical protein L6U99_09585 [Clostridium sp.]|nr:MAG: hypothetical protein L6U99_09585 [Clostridium sp.]